MAEGRAVIVQILRPDNFTPGIEFDIRPRMRNVGAADIFFVRLTNRDTGEILKETVRTTLEKRNGLWTSPMYLTLSQTSDFRARIQFGHMVYVVKIIDDTEDFVIPVFSEPAPEPPPSPGPCPNFWTNPMGWVICTILNSLSVLAEWVTDTFWTIISDTAAWINDQFDNIGDWWDSQVEILQRGWDNVIDGITDWFEEQFENLGDWWTDQVEILQRSWNNVIEDVTGWFNDQIEILQRGWENVVDDITGWVDDQLEIMQRGWNNVISGLEEWLSEQLYILQRGWENVTDGIYDWFDTQIEILQRGWENVTEGIETWFADQVEIMQRGWDNVVEDMQGWFNDQIIILQRGWDKTVDDIHDYINNTIPDVVSGMFDWAKPLIKPIEDAVKFLQDIAGVFTGTYQDAPEYIETQKKIQDEADEIKKIIDTLE